MASHQWHREYQLVLYQFVYRQFSLQYHTGIVTLADLLGIVFGLNQGQRHPSVNVPRHQCEAALTLQYHFALNKPGYHGPTFIALTKGKRDVDVTLIAAEEATQPFHLRDGTTSYHVGAPLNQCTGIH
jgi:hypothetical protein